MTKREAEVGIYTLSLLLFFCILIEKMILCISRIKIFDLFDNGRQGFRKRMAKVRNNEPIRSIS